MEMNVLQAVEELQILKDKVFLHWKLLYFN
jgi:hypothetical protein